MQKIEMRGEARYGDAARHRESAFEQRPVEGFSVEGDEHGAGREAFRQFVQHGMLIAKIAHEKLLYLQAACVPPRDANQKCIGARPACQAGSFRIQKKPLFWVFERGEILASNGFIAMTREQFERDG